MPEQIPQADIAVIGLAVMGQNLVLNLHNNGYKVCCYNRTLSKVDNFLNSEARGRSGIIGSHSLAEMVSKLKRPRKIIMLVKAGSVIDNFIDQLVPLLEPGDILIDGGNSDHLDTTRRCKYLREKNLRFVGCGFSCGGDQTLVGPSLVFGGDSQAWPHIKGIFQKISAKADGEPCCDWVGEDGAAHYVKMVHNGIEYGEMQMYCEAYDIMRRLLGLYHDEMSKVFEEWNKSCFDSYLTKITADILEFKNEDGKPLVTKIRDCAGQKGTGRWTAISALDLGTPLTLISESVFSRCLSALKDERIKASKFLSGPVNKEFNGNKIEFIEHLKRALYATKIISYTQAFMLLREADKKYNWNLNYGQIALIWREGCIIGSSFLDNVRQAFAKNSKLSNLLLDEYFRNKISQCQYSWRYVVSSCALNGIPAPAFSAALSYYDGYRSEKLPANLIQAQRDYFGGHTYELDAEPGKYIHTNWSGYGLKISAETYNA